MTLYQMMQVESARVFLVSWSDILDCSRTRPQLHTSDKKKL